MEEDKYPSWRDALFSEDTVANLRCAVKYAVWHTGYALLTIVGALVVGAMMIAKFIQRLLPSGKITQGAKALGGLVLVPIIAVFEWYDGSTTAKRIAEVAAMLVLLGAAVGLLGLVGYLAYLNPIAFAQTIGSVAIMFAIAAGILEAIERYGDSAASASAKAVGSAKEKAVETPGVRRVFGRCPVHFDLEPKWFKNIDEKMEEVFNKE